MKYSNLGGPGIGNSRDVTAGIFNLIGDIILLAIVIFGCAHAYRTTVLLPMIYADCLRHGYRDASVTWNFESYCIKRLDQTDVVVPFGEATR